VSAFHPSQTLSRTIMLPGIGNRADRPHFRCMPKKPCRCFIHHPYGPPQPTDQLRFAVVNEEHRITSAVWSMFPHSNPKRPDVFVTATGFQGSAKFSFHADVLNYSFLFEAHPRLVAEGVVPAGSRHQQQLPIPHLPWHGLTVRLAENLLSKKGHPPDEYDGTIVALAPPRPGHVLEIGFVLATGPAINVTGAQFAIGEVGSAGRSLVAVGRYSAQDTDGAKHELNAKLASQPIPAHVLAKLSPDEQYAMHLYGIDNGAMVVTEAHNIRFVPPAA